MKGIIFTEFIGLVENAFSLEVLDRVIEQAQVPSGAVYTSVGTYDHRELVSLVVALSKETGVPVPDLVKTYGQHLLGRFVELYPQFFEGEASTLDFIEKVEDYIHGEVVKLYPDAQTPKLQCERHDAGRMSVTYESCRGLADAAEGLILGTAAHFGEDIALSREDLSDGSGQRVRFGLELRC